VFLSVQNNGSDLIGFVFVRFYKTSLLRLLDEYRLTSINVLSNIFTLINVKARRIMEQKELLARMGSLSDATRLEIVRLLSENGELCACELLKKLSITQGTLSHHMKDLAASGIVVVRKDGKWCHYALNAVALCEMADYIDSLCCPKVGCSCGCGGK
jgi:ArsR family transcriptional regulator, arsenate/arsenite/antimonite-responsive transcriptional repressor